MNRIIQNLIAIVTGFLANLTTTDKSNLVAAINEVNAKTVVGTDTNFATNDLTATGDRTHNFAGHAITINDSNGFSVNDNSEVFLSVPVDQGAAIRSYLDILADNAQIATVNNAANISSFLIVKDSTSYLSVVSPTVRQSFSLTPSLFEFKSLDGTGLNVVQLNVSMIGLPIYADESAAVIAGLATDQIYKTSTGELRIKL